MRPCYGKYVVRKIKIAYDKIFLIDEQGRIKLAP